MKKRGKERGKEGRENKERREKRREKREAAASLNGGWGQGEVRPRF